MAVYTKPSILEEAVFPAMAMEPKELTDDWISTLDMEKSLPAYLQEDLHARSVSASGYNTQFRKMQLHGSVSFIRLRMIRPADTHSEITVAQATPSTPIPSWITKNRFNITFTAPAANKKYRGRLVSPLALKTKLRQSYRS